MKLNNPQKNLIKKALERTTGKTILVKTKVQPEILGGVIARVGDRIIDGSVRYRLNALRQQLLAGTASSNIDFLSGAEDGQRAAAADTLVTPGSKPKADRPDRGG